MGSFSISWGFCRDFEFLAGRIAPFGVWLRPFFLCIIKPPIPLKEAFYEKNPFFCCFGLFLSSRFVHSGGCHELQGGFAYFFNWGLSKRFKLLNGLFYWLGSRDDLLLEHSLFFKTGILNARELVHAGKLVCPLEQFDADFLVFLYARCDLESPKRL